MASFGWISSVIRSERPAERVGDHRDRFGQPDVPDAAVVDFLLELLGRQAGADLLLERQAADARVLDPVDGHAIDPLAHAGQHDRQCVHRETRIDAGAEHADLRFLRPRVNLPRLADVRVDRDTTVPRSSKRSASSTSGSSRSAAARS